jgi:hypothetical protein
MKKLPPIFFAGLLMFLASFNRVNAEGVTTSVVVVGDTWSYRQISKEKDKPEVLSSIQFRIGYINKERKLVALVAPQNLSTDSRVVWHFAFFLEQGVCALDVLGEVALSVEETCFDNLQAGRKWGSDQTDSLSRVQEKFTVVGNEEVLVTAGKFKTVRIDIDRFVTDVIYPGVNEKDRGTKRFHTVLWYAPAAKAMVKAQRDFFDVSGKKYLEIREELNAFSIN